MKITYKLALCLNEVFQKYLSKSFVDHESLWLEIILIVNRKKTLLYTNYDISMAESIQKLITKNGTITILKEAFFYTTEVLGRRLALANNLKNQPTNMHALIIAYCQRSENSRWHNSYIERGFYEENNEDDFFKPLAKNLKQQCKLLADQYSDVSCRRRKEFGRYWFINQETCLEVAEELSLFDILKIIPLQSTTNKEPPLLLVRVIESLNKKYGLLRSCGLSPDFWLERNISVSHLTELKQLCIQARKLINNENMSKSNAYQQAFTKLIAGTKKWAGVSSFNELFHSILGQNIMNNQYNTELEHQEPQLEAVINEVLLELPEDYPDDFNPVLRYAFITLIVKETSLYSPNNNGLINDPHFLKLINRHSDYASLSKTTLISTLQQQLYSIIKKHIGH